MRQTIFAAALALVALPVASSTPPPPPEPQYLKGSECLDPNFARSFYSLDDRHLLVDAGKRHYLIEVWPACWNLDFASVIGFRGDVISNRVCGSVHDAVLVRGEPPCRIQGMKLLSKEEYRQAMNDRAAWRKAHRAAEKAKRD
jgi:hypothetical protein